MLNNKLFGDIWSVGESVIAAIPISFGIMMMFLFDILDWIE